MERETFGENVTQSQKVRVSEQQRTDGEEKKTEKEVDLATVLVGGGFRDSTGNDLKLFGTRVDVRYPPFLAEFLWVYLYFLCVFLY